MSSDIKGLVKTSLNLGILELTEKELNLEYAVRSSVGSERKFLEQRLRVILEVFGGSVKVEAEYPAWEYRADSPFREDVVRIYEKLYGKKPRVEAIHAGLECGILAGKLPGLDGVSIGPDMWDIHTTEERLSISSTKRVYEFVLELLRCRHES